ncbi:hypothetical protein [Photorhabdus aegyptia]|uniref:Uncharacterized protein n=1 Tax=Photorhabdus aegyptia TaxID=2805098 RepID=A0A022PEF8_9GAMM|nr:hypothetical protein [Photorhabdus aegyptia]EYU13904.1 hypothetical protein BA1DRAFT_03589 [Photorhabdus aegyptia]
MSHTHTFSFAITQHLLRDRSRSPSLRLSSVVSAIISTFPGWHLRGPLSLRAVYLRAPTDHSSLGRFIYQHQTVLTGMFFQELILSVLRRSQSGISCLAGDGKVIEATCSHYHFLTQEAISREKRALTAVPATVQTEKRIKQLEQGTEVLRYRQENHEKK